MPDTTEPQNKPNRKEVFDTIRSILDNQVQCVLATQKDGLIFQHLMAYDMDDTLATVFLASFRNTRKVANMMANPRVSLLWDNRTGNNRDHADGFALSAQGTARIVDTAAQAHAKAQLLKRNDSLQAMLDNDNAVLVAIDVAHYHLALGYSETFFYEP
jgi:general stress protein 26